MVPYCVDSNIDFVSESQVQNHLRVYQALAAAKGCAYGRWYNPIRRNSYFPIWHHHNRTEWKQPKEGEEMPILFDEESMEWTKWHLADTVVELGLVASSLRGTAIRAGLTPLSYVT